MEFSEDRSRRRGSIPVRHTVFGPAGNWIRMEGGGEAGQRVPYAQRDPAAGTTAGLRPESRSIVVGAAGLTAAALLLPPAAGHVHGRTSRISRGKRNQRRQQEEQRQHSRKAAASNAILRFPAQHPLLVKDSTGTVSG